MPDHTLPSALAVVIAVVAVAAVVGVVDGYPTGAPASRCGDMTPNHGANSALSPASSAVTVMTSSTTYTPGQVLSVTVAGPQGSTFAGLMLQARDEADGRQGAFTLANGETNLQLLNCDGAARPGTGVTHTSRAGKASITVAWTAPTTSVGTIRFRATVVKAYAVFYVGILSTPVTFMGSTPTATNTTTIPISNGTMMTSTPTTRITTKDTGSAACVIPSSIITVVTALLGLILPLAGRR